MASFKAQLAQAVAQRQVAVEELQGSCKQLRSQLCNAEDAQAAAARQAAARLEQAQGQLAAAQEDLHDSRWALVNLESECVWGRASDVMCAFFMCVQWFGVKVASCSEAASSCTNRPAADAQAAAARQAAAQLLQVQGQLAAAQEDLHDSRCALVDQGMHACVLRSAVCVWSCRCSGIE